jgi:uncharacterized surface protein with fasciclin (FAS1) repeats
MKKIRLYLLFLLPAILVVHGCKKPDFAAQQEADSKLLNVGDYIKNNFDFTILAAALEKTGLMDSLNNPGGQYTVFAPEDAGFAVDSILSVADLDKFSVDSLRFIIKNHILRSKLFFSDIPMSLDNLYPNMNGLNLYLSENSGGAASLGVSGVLATSVQTATSTTPTWDIPLANGVIHILSRPLKYYSGTVQAFLASRPELSSFVEGLRKFNQWDSLAIASPYTIVAPVNNAFTINGITPDSIAAMDTSKLQSTLFGGYVAYPHHVFTTDPNMLNGTGDITLAGGYSMGIGYQGFILIGPDGQTLGPNKDQPGGNDRFVLPLDGGSTDYVCTNGVVHLIGQLMVLPGDVPK